MENITTNDSNNPLGPIFDYYGLPHQIPESIYRTRVKRLRKRLEEKGLDGILLIDQASLFYLFGFDQIGYWVFQAVWLPTNPAQAVIGICRAPDKALLERGIGIDEIIVWLDDAQESPVLTILRGVKEQIVSKIAVELNTHALRADYASEIFNYAAQLNLEVVAEDELVTQQREIKDQFEISFMKQAGLALDRAFEAVRDTVAVNVLETDLSQVALNSLLADGCDPSAVSPCISAARRTLFQTHLSAKPLPIENGDLVTVEIGASVNRYHAVGYHTYFTDSCPQRYIKQYRDLQEAILKGFDAISPGQDAADVAHLIHEHLAKTGNSRSGRHVGYATGIGFPPTWLETLRIKSSQSYELTPGMTFFLFAGAPTHDAKRHIGYGIPVLINENGAEKLSVTL